MSKYNRPVFSRPRTKVYDTNYNIGESYYKSALDGIDRKYGRTKPREDDFFGLPTTSQPIFERRPEFEPRRTRTRDPEDDFFEDGRRQASSAFKDFDAVFEGRMKNGLPMDRMPTRETSALDDEIEDDMASSMRKLKTVKFARAMADEFDNNSARKEFRQRSKLDFSDKVMDSVGLSGRAKAVLEEEGLAGKRRSFKATASDLGDAADELTKWTALKPTINRKYTLEADDEATNASGAAMRAMKSRARLEDLETEMQALSERSAAREKRVRDLKALVQENEANAMDNLHSTVRVLSSIQSEKKVNF